MNRQWIKVNNFAKINNFNPSLYLNTSKWMDTQIIQKNFEPHTTNFIKNFLSSLNQKAVCIDVGANIGYYTILMSNFAKKIYSFEPVSVYFSVLKEVCLKNNIEEKVNLNNFALSCIETEIDINVMGESATFYMLDGWGPKNLEGKEKVMCYKIDSIINEKIDLIKIDCDGHDPFVIQGAENIINKYKPIIVIEIAKEYYEKAGWSFEKFYLYISNLGYKL